MSTTQITTTLVHRLFLATSCFISITVAKSNFEQERQDAKPWYTQDTHLFGHSLPISPVTFAVIAVGMYQFYRIFTDSSWCEASHILIEDHSEATRKRLLEIKKEINDDPVKFEEFAKKISSCPSKSGGGSLGRFKQGDMSPQFDKACFEKDALIKKTIGPVETSFGWHLLFITGRKMV
jgi:peptidyl-prolyl cis-trans isomerase C